MARHTEVTHEAGSPPVARIEAPENESTARIVIPDTELLFSARFKKSGSDLVLTGDDGRKIVVSGYFDHDRRPDLAAPGGAFLSGDLVERLAGPENPGQYAQVGAPAGAAIIGRVERLGGSATVQRANGVVEELNIGDSIRQGDIVETRSGSTLGLSFIDGTAFNMGASARMAITELVFDASSSSNSAVFSLVKGAISFVAGQAAKTGDMRVDTPVASMGIRGTAVNTNIVTDVNGQAVSVTYSLMQDPDGSIGAFNIIDPTTRVVIATVTTTDNVYTVTPTAAGLNALSNPKSAQEIAQELAIAQALFPIFLANPANFAVQPPPPDTPKAPPAGGSSTPPGGSTPPPPPQPGPEPNPDRGENNTGNDTVKVVDVGGSPPPPEFVLPANLPPSVFANLPAHLVEAVTLGDSGSATSVAQIFKVDLDGTVSIDTGAGSGWQDVGNGIFMQAGAYGVAALNKGGASAGELTGAGWTSLGNGIFEKQIGTYVVRVSGVADTLTYALNNELADGLGPQDHPTETFVIGVVDDDNGRAFTTVVFTVDGRNDPPNLDPDTGPHPTTEVPNATGGAATLDLAGSLGFTDPELNQTHDVDSNLTGAVWSGASPGRSIPALTQAALAGALQASVSSDSTGTGVGQLAWNFQLADELVDFLRAGETLTLTYDVITVRDNLGAVSTQPITIVITGTNDRPEVAPDSTAFHAGVELADTAGSNTPQTLGGTLSFSDADLNDAHTASAALANNGAIWSGGGTIPFASFAAISIAMTAAIGADSTHTGSGSVNWSFYLPDHYLDFLAAGETLELTYVVGVEDDSAAANGASATQQVKIVVTGTNDDPVMAAAPAPVSVDEGAQIDIVGMGVSDPDATDVLTATLQVSHGTITLLGNTSGLHVSFLPNGEIEISGSAAAVNAVLAAGVQYTHSPAAGHDTDPDALIIQVSDGNGGAATQTIDIGIVPSTGLPQTNPVARTIDEDSGAVPITLTGSDSDGTVVAFRIVDIANLHGRLYDANNNLLDVGSEIGSLSSAGTFTVYFVPDQDFNGQATFKFAAIDDDNQADASPATATVTVNAVNDTPVVTVPTSVVATDEDTPVAISGLAVSDTDGDLILVQLTATSSIALASVAGLTGVSGNGTSIVTFIGTAAAINAALDGMIYTPTQDFSGDGSISYSFSDGSAPAITGTIDISVAAVNDAPENSAAIADQTIGEGAPWVFQIPAGAFTDVDSTLSFSASLADGSGLPAWLSFDPQARTFSGTPPQNFNGALDLKVTASDGQYAISDTFSLFVTPVNDPPTLSAPIADQGSLEDGFWSFQVPAGTFTDVDSTLTFSATLGDGSTLPSWIFFDPQTRTFSGTPPQDFNGQIDFKVTASDGQSSVSDTFTLDVGAVNDAPTASEPASPVATVENTSVQIFGFSVDDADGDILTVHLDAPSALTLSSTSGLIGLTGDGTSSVSFSGTAADINAALNGMTYQPTADFTGVESIAYTVDDGVGTLPAVTGSIDVNVNAPNNAPLLTVFPDPAPLSEDNVTTSGVLISATNPAVTLDFDMTGWTPYISTLPDVVEFDGHYYMYLQLPGSWTNAQSIVQGAYAALGGYLVNITSQDENTFVHNLLGGRSAWIGATDSGSEGNWSWTGGPEAGEQFWQGAGPQQGGQGLGYANWWGSEPNGGTSENYAFIDHNGVWTDVSDTNGTPQGFVVEFTDFNWWLKVGTYGTAYFFEDSGVLSYILDNDSDAVQLLDSNQQVSEAFDIVATDQAGNTGSVTVEFEISGEDEAGSTNLLPDTYDPLASGAEDTVIYVSLYGSDPDGSVTGFRIGDMTNLHGTLYRDWSLTEVLQAGDLVNTFSGGSASVYFEPDAGFNGTSQFWFAAVDNSGGEDPYGALATIDVYAVNDVPVVDLDSSKAGTGFELTIAGNGEEFFIADAPTITDDDSTTLSSATVTLTNGQLGDMLISADIPTFPGGISWQYFGRAGDANDPLGIEFWGDASLADYQAAIEQVRFATLSSTGGDRQIEVTVYDGWDYSDPAYATFTVDPIFNGNAQPVIGATSDDDDPIDGVVQPGTPEMSIVNGILLATDPDAGDPQVWQIAGGSELHGPDYDFAIDRFSVTRTGSGAFSFVDEFDGSDPAPPDGPDLASLALPYAVNGGDFIETGNQLVMAGANSLAVSNFTSSAGDDPVFGQFATLRTNNQAGVAAGLRSNSDFSVSGLFDFALPDETREAYGIRLSDRIQGGSGNPPDQLGNDILELAVIKAVDGKHYVSLLQLDNANHTVDILERYSLEGLSFDQIRLNLTHDNAAPGEVHASFDLINQWGGETTIKLNSAGYIFSDEDWTRAQFFARAPETSDTVKVGTYGMLTLTQAGAWTYALNLDDPDTVLLPGGYTAYDSFDVMVSDEHGGFDTETIAIEVVGEHKAGFAVASDAGYDLGSLYAALVDSEIVVGYGSDGFVAEGTSLPFAFEVHGYGFEYSGPANDPNLDLGTITGIDIYNSSYALLATFTDLSIDVTELGLALDQYELSGGGDRALLDDIFGATAYEMWGAGGSDRLVGADRNDILHGGESADTLIGGAGHDVLFGDAGNDTFYFEPGSGHDTVMDFVPAAGAGDIIVLGTGGNAFSVPTNFLGEVDLAAWKAQGGIEEDGNDVLLHLSVTSAAEWGGPTDIDTIRLVNVSLGSLHGSDFFVPFQVFA